MAVILLIVAGGISLPAAIPAQKEMETDEGEEKIAGARQNPLLREYFQEQYKFFNTTPGLEPNESFREEYIDRRIDHFLEQVEEKLDHIHRLLNRATEDRADALDEKNGKQKRALAVQRLAEALDELENKADDLRDQLAFIFRDLDNEKDLEEAQLTERKAPLFGAELEFISDQLVKADARIREYLFLNLNTVQLDELKKENMLVNLYWAQKVAEHTVEEIRKMH